MTVATVLVWAPAALVTAALMDLWAAFLHRFVWHRALYFVHRTHHERRRGRFEANDALSALHAPFAIALVLYGCVGPEGAGREIAFGVGVGATLFGVSYLLVHDGLVHRRLPVRFLLRVPYLQRVARAHRVHHAGAEGGPPHGLFFGPLELAIHRRLTASRARDPRARSGGPPRSSSVRGPAARDRA